VRKRDLEQLLAAADGSPDLEALQEELQEELADQDDALAAVAGQRRRDKHPGSPTHGRLTEQARARLERERKAGTSAPCAAPVADQQLSTWGDAEQRGPRPYPGWVITELDALDQDLGILCGGKEADVAVVERTVAGSGQSCLLAAKRYRDSDHRLFHRDAGYLEGRRVRDSREMRAMRRRSQFGRNLIAQRWAAAEFAALCELWSAGAPVPYPVQRIGGELLLEFIGAPDGTAAPRLVELRPRSDQLAGLWQQLVSAMVLLARQGRAHGDLSAYNLLVHDGTLVMIDLPQLVDIPANPHGTEFLRRDVHTVCGWFRARGLPPDVADPDALADLLLAEARFR